MILESIEHGPLIWPTVEENGVIRTKKYAKLSTTEKIQDDYDMKATNIILQDFGFVVPVFSPRDDLVACLNKAMAFLTAVAFSRGNTTSGQARVVKCYNCQGKGHMARKCTQPKRPRNAAWYKEKAMLAEAQEARQILDDEQLAFLADPGIPTDQAQIIIPHNAAF
nr:retrovirus-related Pol polyprotein from transposon TNT 1-94 [Tanacetum cinerariifolium]